jgi:hypothetical protein
MDELHEKILDLKNDVSNIEENKEHKNIRSLKNIKRDIYELNKLIVELTDITDIISQKISQKQNIISKHIGVYEKKLQRVENIFNIKNYLTKKINKYVLVDIGSGIKVKSIFYRDIYMIPNNNYGAILLDNKMRLVYKYTNEFYVSCTDIIINDAYGANFRTICCNNKNNCAYGNNCRYYHDPILWKDSDHIQRFYKNHIIKDHPTFGDGSKFNSIKNSINIENLRTLARYCVIMNLMIQNVISG